MGRRKEYVPTERDVLERAEVILLLSHGYGSREDYVAEHGESSLRRLTDDAGFRAESNWAFPDSSPGWVTGTLDDEMYLQIRLGGADLSRGALVGVEMGKLFAMPMRVALPREVARKKRIGDRRRAARERRRVSNLVGGGDVGGGGVGSSGSRPGDGGGHGLGDRQRVSDAAGGGRVGGGGVGSSGAGAGGGDSRGLCNWQRVSDAADGGGVGGSGVGSRGARAGGGGGRGLGDRQRVSVSAGRGGVGGVGAGSERRGISVSAGGGGAGGVGAGSDGHCTEGGDGIGAHVSGSSDGVSSRRRRGLRVWWQMDQTQAEAVKDRGAGPDTA
jgi:hypothetical protein